MGVLKTNFNGNVNLGLYGFATDKYCVIGRGLKKSLLEDIEKILKVPVYEISINNSPLVGVYCSGNEDLLLVPDLIKENEERALKVPYRKVKTKLNALGNNFVIKEDRALVNPEFEGNLEGFKVVKMKIDNHGTVGSCVVVTKKGCLVNMNVDEKELKKIEKNLGTKAEIGSVNKGNPYVKSGIISNSNGYLIGSDTTGMEVMRIEEVLK